MQARSESVDERVRRRLRELRLEQGLTLQQVAARSSIDVSTLSRLESGKRRLALDHLPRLANALGVSTDALVASVPGRDPRVRGEPVKTDGMTMWPLSARPSTHQVFEIRVGARRRRPPETLPVHDGYEWLYVIDGKLRLVLGEEDFTIEAGEAVEFSTMTPHWFGAAEGPVRLISIFGPEGQRVHVRG